MCSASSHHLPDVPTNRTMILDMFRSRVEAMLIEKAALHGEKAGFFETNSLGDYTHALGETKIKLGEIKIAADPTYRQRLIIKAITWLYLIFETEVLGGPEQNRTRS